MPHDALIIGGGPAGLSAALALGRACKRVVLCDAGPPRNAATDAVHNFLTRDGTPPRDMRAMGRAELERYGVEIREARVHDIARRDGGFRVQLDGGGEIEARRVLLALGMIDEHPDLPGYAPLWGKSIFICPYCHAWEVKGRALGVVAHSEARIEWSLFMTGWSRDLVVFLDGSPEPPPALRARLDKAGIRIEPRRIRALLGSEGHLQAVELEGGEEVLRDALFVHPPQRQTPLVTRLGLALDQGGFVRVDERGETSIPGIHAAGDLTTMKQGAVVAAAAGMMAASFMNHALTMEDAERPRA
ncbi:NAD(P)/FAD-dependent oxidoreductase [Polyangium aurulentum]|uniref:NAD(P)/FAD-dependent oxidoreductase n=1 Tax=Polyangium aurulentum TaxID=2567896 RepID=UPI0010AE3B60|nr:NAD(P)/FAD-dependent oxidoreductase [Polyangium aurulentum]UQA58106.1 NAD(P)/FAD-dependent oxidoreductase [Polyangium aurulentum]